MTTANRAKATYPFCTTKATSRSGSTTGGAVVGTHRARKRYCRQVKKSIEWLRSGRASAPGQNGHDNQRD
ncbi:MAG: hypothetical protein ACLTSX_13270 [Collinsella sp.]